MPVYFIQAGKGGPVKIGYSENVARRLCKLQCDNPAKLVIVRVFVGGEVQESSLHQRFADFKIRGDWFFFCPAMLGDLGLEELPVPAPSPNRPGLDAWMKAKKLSNAELASRLNVHVISVSKYRSGTTIPRRNVMDAITRVTGGEVTASDFYQQAAA